MAIHINRLSKADQRDGDRPIVRNAQSLWQEQPALAVEEIARKLHCSVSALRKAFQEKRNESPIVCQTRLRIERAVRFLQTSTLILEPVAELCGFDSASHLFRHIKAATGKSPGQWRPIQ